MTLEYMKYLAALARAMVGGIDRPATDEPVAEKAA
jgi:hypothetical protein